MPDPPLKRKRPTVQQVLVRGGLRPTRATPQQRRVFNRLVGCRRGYFGIQQHHCTECGSAKVTMTSCADRHCSICGHGPRAAWRERVARIALDCDHIHVVVTAPHEINELYDLSEHNTRQIASLYFECSALALDNILARRYGCEAGQIQVLHTWNQKLERHLHIHTLISAGGMSLDGSRWIDIPLEDREAIERELAIEVKQLFLDHERPSPQAKVSIATGNPQLLIVLRDGNSHQRRADYQ